MTFTDWLNSLGIVITNMFTWFGNACQIMLQNWMVMTLVGIGTFGFLFYTILHLVLDLRSMYKRPKNKDID